MLGLWHSHAQYQEFVISNLVSLFHSQHKTIEFYADQLSMLYSLNLDDMKSIVCCRYSPTGRPSNQQPELFRSFILMSKLKYHSIPKWVKFLRSNDVLCAAIGVTSDSVPGTGTHYDYISRLWLANPDIEKANQDSLHPFVAKPRKKLGKNQKQPPRHPGIIEKLVEQVLQGRSINHYPEKLLQQIFVKVIVEPSAKLNLLGDTNKLDISGDGTCINSGGSSLGIKVCDCKSKGIYNCKCHRRFSGPDARRGWDSYHEVWYYGHCAYLLTVYNPDLKKDLPIHFRMVQAQRYDGVTAIFALSEVRKLYPFFTFNEFIGDAAHDNYPTYKLLDEWNMKAIISLNPKGKGINKYQPPIGFTEGGAPICSCGIPMIKYHHDKKHHRIKYRCPLVMGKISECQHRAECSPSSYGRVVHVKPKDDLRFFTIVPRGSEQWSTEMKKRTASERVNKRILEDYDLEAAHSRGKKRTTWWTFIHSANIHLDAQQFVLNINILDILKIAVLRAS